MARLSLDELRGEPRDAIRIARVELLRSYRAILDTQHRALLSVAIGIFFLAYAGVIGAASFFYGRIIADEPEALVVNLPGVIAVGLLGFSAFFSIQRTAKQIGEPPDPAVTLVATSHRPVAIGGLLAEIGRIAILAGPLFVIGGIGFGIGAGVPLAAVIAPLFLFGVIAAGVSLGYPLGFAARYLVSEVAIVEKYSGAIGILSAFVIPLGYAFLWATGGIEAMAALLRSPRLGRVGAPLIATVPGVAVDPGVVAAVVSFLVLVPIVSAAAAVPLARILWFEDYESGETGEVGGAIDAYYDRLFSSIAARETRVVAKKSVRRAIRAPVTVQYAIVPAFFLIYEVQMAIVRGHVPARFPVLVGLVGALGTGAMFTLNPLGNEGPVLPVTLLAGIDSREFLAGLVLAEMAIGLPLTLLAVAILWFLSPLSLVVLIALLAATVALCLVSAGVASFLGMHFPKHEAQSIRGREIVSPSGWAFGGHLLAVILIGLPAVIPTLGPAVSWATSVTSLSATALRLLGIALSVGIGAAVAWPATVRAIDLIDDYYVD